MKKSEILRRAKKIIEANEDCPSRYICIAISRAEDSITSFELRAWVLDLLYPNTTYEGWRIDNHPKAIMTRKDYIEARFQWIDWMIAYWEKKGQ